MFIVLYPTPVDLLFKLRKAKSEETLEIMVGKLAKRKNYSFNRSLHTYELTATTYNKLGNKLAANFFRVVAHRETEIKTNMVRNLEIESWV